MPRVAHTPVAAKPASFRDGAWISPEGQVQPEMRITFSCFQKLRSFFLEIGEKNKSYIRHGRCQGVGWIGSAVRMRGCRGADRK